MADDTRRAGGRRPSGAAGARGGGADAARSRFFPWAHAYDRERGGRPALSRDQIVDAAIRILDDEGLEALSMRRLGQELNAGATSLYWHIRNKDELLDLVLDRLIGEVVEEVGRPRGWRAWMTSTARSLRRVLLRHRAVAPVLGERPTFGPNALIALEGLLTALREDGFADEPALYAATTVTNWATGFAVFEVRDPVGPSASDADREVFVEEFQGFVRSLPPDEFPTTVALLPLGAAISIDRQFEYGLEVLLDGIEAHEQRRRGDPPA
jgi:AcrR family transcriptional regulator